MEPFPGDIFNLADIVLRVAREDPERASRSSTRTAGRATVRAAKRHSYAELSADAESVCRGAARDGRAELTRIVFMSPQLRDRRHRRGSHAGGRLLHLDRSLGRLSQHRGAAQPHAHPEAFVGNALAHLGRITFGWGPRDLRKARSHGKPTIAGAESSPDFHPARARGRCEGNPCRTGAATLGRMIPAPFSTPPAAPGKRNRRCTCIATSVRCSATRTTAGAGIRTTRSGGYGRLSRVPVHPHQCRRNDGGAAHRFCLAARPSGLGCADPSHQRLQGGVVFRRAGLIENLAREALARNLTMPLVESRHRGRGADRQRPVERMMSVGHGLRRRGGGEPWSHRGHAVDRAGTVASTLAVLWNLTEQEPGVSGCALPGRRTEDRRHRGRSHRIHRGNLATATGQVGEILVRGKHVSPEYYLDPESTRKNKVPDPQGTGTASGMLAISMCRTGSGFAAGCLAGEGWGGNVFPLPVEPLFDAHPKVRRSGLVECGPAGEQPSCASRSSRTLITTTSPDCAGTAHAGRRLLHGEQHPCHSVSSAGCRWIRHNSKIERPQLAKWAARQLLT